MAAHCPRGTVPAGLTDVVWQATQRISDACDEFQILQGRLEVAEHPL